MPSPEHAANLERVLTRAAKECEVGAAWFGEGLPQALKRAVEATGSATRSASPDVAFVDAEALNDTSPGRLGACRVIALSDAGLDQLGALVDTAESSGLPITRLICPFGVFDFTQEGLRIREIQHGLTAADVQKRLATPLWSGPDLKPL